MDPIKNGAEEMWLLFAVGSSFFAGITAILAKCGIRKTDSDVATAIRTAVGLFFSWLMVAGTGAAGKLGEIGFRTYLFLVLSGFATGASWLCYFRALQLGEVNQVAPVDKSSTVLTILLAMIFLREKISFGKAAAVVLIGAGIFLMIGKKESSGMPGSGKEGKKSGWFFYAALSAVFASLTAILGKIGIEGVDSNLGTAIRTGVVLVMAWILVFVKGKGPEVKAVKKGELGFICLSGFATGASWLCYFRALQEGPASAVVPIDKLSVLVTIVFSRIVFGEKLTKKAALGAVLLTAGTVMMAVM